MSTSERGVVTLSCLLANFLNCANSYPFYFSYFTFSQLIRSASCDTNYLLCRFMFYLPPSTSYQWFSVISRILRRYLLHCLFSSHSVPGRSLLSYNTSILEISLLKFECPFTSQIQCCVSSVQMLCISFKASHSGLLTQYFDCNEIQLIWV